MGHVLNYDGLYPKIPKRNASAAKIGNLRFGQEPFLTHVDAEEPAFSFAEVSWPPSIRRVFSVSRNATILAAATMKLVWGSIAGLRDHSEGSTPMAAMNRDGSTMYSCESHGLARATPSALKHQQ
jgi:hypothetical protein